MDPVLRRWRHHEQLFWQLEAEAADDGEEEAGGGADDQRGDDGGRKGGSGAEVPNELEVEDVGEAEEEGNEKGKEVVGDLVAEGGLAEGEAEVGKGDGEGGEGSADEECKKGGWGDCGHGCGGGGGSGHGCGLMVLLWGAIFSVLSNADLF